MKKTKEDNVVSIAKQIEEFFKETGQEVFIEAEGRPSVIEKFIDVYNCRYGHHIDEDENGIIVLQDDANKWGLELRMYFNDKSGIPSAINVTKTRGYRGEYLYRINDIQLIRDMFSLGYEIGCN